MRGRELRQFTGWLLLISRSSWECYQGRREDLDMRAFLSACVIAVVLAIAGYYGLRAIQEPVSEAFSTSAVRLNS
jgi:hypothetical protein